MATTADDRADLALLGVLEAGPTDLLGLLRGLRTSAPDVLRGGEGVVHVLLHRGLRRGHLRVARGATPTSLTYYARGREASTPPSRGGATGGEEHEFAPLAPDTSKQAITFARAVRDPADRGRIARDVAAHHAALGEAPERFGRARPLAALLRRVDRGQRTVAVVQSAGDWLRRLLYHDGLWLAGVLVAFFVVRGFFVEVFHIPSESMLPTLAVKDRVAVRKSSAVPDRFDIITFNLNGTTYVKRLVGLPGESLAIVRGDLFVDGKRIVKPDDLSSALRRRLASWDFSPDALQGPGPSWRRVALNDDVSWVWDAPPLRPNGAVSPGSMGYTFHLADGYLRAHAQVGDKGSVRLGLSRVPHGRHGRAASSRWTLTTGARGTHVMAETRDANGKRLPPETLLREPDWRVSGAMDVQLALIDGVLQVEAGAHRWRKAVAPPAGALHFEVGTIGRGARLGTVTLDADQHWSHRGELAVPVAQLGRRHAAHGIVRFSDPRRCRVRAGRQLTRQSRQPLPRQGRNPGEEPCRPGVLPRMAAKPHR